MTGPVPDTEHRPAPAETDRSGHDRSVGDLTKQVTEQTSRLVRDELRLAQAEMTEKGKRAELGAGLFGGPG